jgi:hypothetical protein
VSINCRRSTPTRLRRRLLPANTHGPRTRVEADCISNNDLFMQIRLAGGWWLVLICSERKVLMAGG